jgi:RNA polymerase sigma-70 factor (ECF subfamily)
MIDVVDTSTDDGASASSFEAFYARHRDPIGRALAITLRDGELAADALDEAMARAYQRWDQVSVLDNPAGWVYRVGLNWARSVVRKITRPGRTPRAFEMVSSSPAFDADIDRALRQLSVDQRAVVVCRFFIGYSEAETAEALGVKAGTVKSRLSRALDALRTSTHIRQTDSEVTR